MVGHSARYRAEPADRLLIEPLDSMTAIYQRRSGVTHIVAEPVPEILMVMGGDVLTAQAVADRLAGQFDIDSASATGIVEARLAEMAQLGLVEQQRA